MSGYLYVGTPETNIKLHDTLESGMSFCWQRDHGFGAMYDETSTVPRYCTVLPAHDSPTNTPEVIRLWRHSSDHLQWQASFDAASVLYDRLRLRDDLTAVRDSMPDNPTLNTAFEEWHGLRVPNDPSFPTLISFICSSQMRVERIHQMQHDIAREYGDTVQFDDATYHAFPTPHQLANVPESELKALNLGYRARYVAETATAVASQDRPLTTIATQPYDKAHGEIQSFLGVGDKVADCVLLYGLGFTEALPIDTWVEKALTQVIPDAVTDSYQETAHQARDYFGQHAGYAQAYLFHHFRATENTTD
jgi:N-glycosylase/DNA lyase